MNILIYGNCQTTALHWLIKTPTQNVVCCHTENSEEEFNNILGWADLVITQPVSAEYRGKPWLSTDNVIKRANKVIIFDSLMKLTDDELAHKKTKHANLKLKYPTASIIELEDDLLTNSELWDVNHSNHPKFKIYESLLWKLREFVIDLEWDIFNPHDSTAKSPHGKIFDFKRSHYHGSKLPTPADRKVPTMDIRDEHNLPIDVERFERMEQDRANQYVIASDVVLELGGRYGSVSCVINKKLTDKTAHVVVEPDKTVWTCLERNKQVNGCNWQTIQGFLSTKPWGLIGSGYGASFNEDPNSEIPYYPLPDMKFTALVADCEGYLGTFLEDFPQIWDNLRMMTFEADYPNKCDYDKIRAELVARGFTKIESGWMNTYVRA